MAPRLNLQTLLVSLLGSTNVYFQPPSTLQMKYPAIVYRRDDIQTDFANDKPYNHKRRYSVTVIDPNPDSLTVQKIANLPLCIFDRHYVADQLNHDVFNLFF